MNGYAALRTAGIEYRTVHPVSVHPPATEPWQQGRMYIDYPTPEGINHILRNQPQKPGQNHKVGLPATKHHQHLSGLIKLGPVEKKCIHPECRSPFQNLSLRLV